MATKYVDNSGSPSCSDVADNGSEASPWCTVTYAITQLSASDTLFVKTGTYTESFTIGSGLSGSSGNPTIIKAFVGHTPTVGNLGNTGRIKILGASWVDFEGFTITNLNQGLFVEDSSNVNVRDIIVHNMNQEGIRVKDNSSSVLVEGCTVFDTGTGASNGEGVYIGTGSGGPLDNTNTVTVRNNTIHDTDDEGVELKPGTHDCIVDGNTLYNIVTGSSSVGSIEVNQRDAGAQSWTSNPAHIIRNNIIRDSDTAIRLGTGSTTYNNVIHDITSGHDGILVDNINSDSFTRVIYHNTINLPIADSVVVTAGTVDIKNNIGPTSPPTTDNIAASDAYFFDVANNDYHIVVGSTPVDDGLNLTATVSTDIEGKTRPASTPDIGAYELVDVWYAASCSSTDVQAAADAASEGETVLIPPGTCTYTTENAVRITNKGLIIKGAGIGVTIIKNGVAGARNFRVDLQVGDSTFEIADITFDGDSLDTGGKALVSVDNGGIDAFRLHHLDFTNMEGTSISANLEGNEGSGLIDNVTFDMNPGAGDKAIRLFGTNSSGGEPFARSIELGSEKFIFIEDCNFNFSDKEDGATDAFAGARFVFRHNTVKETHGGSTHGADSGSFRGVHSFEIYGNTFDRTTAGNIRAVHFRSGSGVMYSNAYTGNYGNLEVSNNRSRPQSFSPWGACDGTSVWDENKSGQAGYACLDQIGHIFGEFSGGSNDLEGMYFWLNTQDGTPVTSVTVSETSMEDHLKDDREFYVEDTSFDGTSGVGVGTLASRPATCTPMVGYWATDESKFYRCLTTDTWTLYYEPFTYPHPLRTAAGVTVSTATASISFSTLVAAVDIVPILPATVNAALATVVIAANSASVILGDPTTIDYPTHPIPISSQRGRRSNSIGKRQDVRS